MAGAIMSKEVETKYSNMHLLYHTIVNRQTVFSCGNIVQLLLAIILLFIIKIKLFYNLFFSMVFNNCLAHCCYVLNNVIKTYKIIVIFFVINYLQSLMT